jgi:hypothetical protein
MGKGGGQYITALSSAKTEISLGGYYTIELSHQWSTRDTDYCPWCPGTTGTIDHMFFDCPSVTAKLLHELLGPHPPQKKLTLYGYSTLDTTPQHLLVLAKSTVSKTWHPAPHARLPAHVPQVHRDALQPVGRGTATGCTGRAIHYIGLSLGWSPQPSQFIIIVFMVNFGISNC